MNKIMVKKITIVLLALFTLTAAKLEEGMFPLSELSKLDLKKAGLEIPVSEIYNPNGTSLIDALVRVGGCTGSFVSDQGLIITNHHCAFGSVQAISSVEKDYISDGFYAKNLSDEAKSSIEVRITQAYEDVSYRVLEGTDPILDPIKRSEKIADNIKKIEKEENIKFPEFDNKISEMFTGKTYTLFRYILIKDVRLVYAPPRSIGEFGGETDNWVWPRHNGDFAFFRAYVGKDGKPAEYSPDNVPYIPKKVLEINQNGLKENDFVFILGYPGRTFRNQPSKYLEYQQQVLLPNTSEWFDFMINTIIEIGKNNKEKAISLSTFQKQLANVTKNYKGKMQGLNRTDVLSSRKEEDIKIETELISSDLEMKANFGTVIPQINGIYENRIKTGKKDFLLGQLYNQSFAFRLSQFMYEVDTTISKLNKKEKQEYFDSIYPNKLAQFKKNPGIRDLEFESIVLKELLVRIYELDNNSINKFNSQFKKNYKSEIEQLVNSVYSNKEWGNYASIMEKLEAKPEKSIAKKNTFRKLIEPILIEFNQWKLTEKIYNGQLEVLLPKYTSLRAQLKKSNFIPDANATLRFTYGNVKSYSPDDAVNHYPFTTIKGILEKNTLGGDFYLPSNVKAFLQNADLKSIVCFLYNLDTTGGNSGSPVLDSKGRLVGVNFDRTFTATINDFAWNESYSRSVGVDIRYVLLVLKDFSDADRLLKEMKLNN